MTIIAFISQKGGVGKSTLAQALAVVAKEQQIKVLLADCDPQQQTSYEWATLRNEIIESGKMEPDLLIPCQAFNSVKNIWPLVKKFQLIIIDGPARTSQATKEIAEKADLVIQPTGASRADLTPAIKEFNALKKIGIPTKKLLFVLTRLSSQAEAKAIQNYLGKSDYNYSPFYLYEKASYKQAQNEGKTITEVNYENLKRQALKLIDSLLDYL